MPKNGQKRERKKASQKWLLESNHCGLIFSVNFTPIAKRALASDAACMTLTSIHVYYWRKWEPLDWTSKKEVHCIMHFDLSPSLSLTHTHTQVTLTSWWTWISFLSHYSIAKVSFTFCITYALWVMTLVYPFVNTSHQFWKFIAC